MGAAVKATEALRADYLGALLAAEPRRARRLATEAVRNGLDPRRVYLEVLHPALEEVGRMWERAEISVAMEHLATATTRSVMAELAPQLARGDQLSGLGRGRAVVACSDGELHDMGSRMVADFLEADGWEVLWLGGLTPVQEVVALARDTRVDVVALSAALPDRLPEVARACGALRALARPPLVIVGGRALAGGPGAAALGADLAGLDLEALVAELRGRYPLP